MLTLQRQPGLRTTSATHHLEHIAEETLNCLVRSKGRVRDGFEGNAQSFRIVTKLAASDAVPASGAKTIEGLNLTRATLNGILKYPWLYNKNSK